VAASARGCGKRYEILWRFIMAAGAAMAVAIPIYTLDVDRYGVWVCPQRSIQWLPVYNMKMYHMVTALK